MITPKIAFIRLTTNCNAKCEFCNFWKIDCKNFDKQKLFKLLFDLKEKKIEKIIFTGGEPTLYPYFEELNKFLGKQNISFSLITNGSIIYKNINKFFKYKKPETIIFSLDSTDMAHNKNRCIENLNDKVIFAIKQARDAKISVSINTVVTNKNYFGISKMAKNSIMNKVDEWHIIPIQNNLNLRLNSKEWLKFEKICNKIKIPGKIQSIFNFNENINYFNFTKENYTEEYYKKNRCHISDLMIFVEIDGNVYRCNCFDFKKANKFFLGNISNLNSVLNSTIKDIEVSCKRCNPRNQHFNKYGYFLKGQFYFCPFCNKYFDKFLSFGNKYNIFKKIKIVGGGYRKNALCPNCGGIDRQRLLYLYINQNKKLFAKNKKVLHIAPENNIMQLFKKIGFKKYIVGDLNPHKDIKKINVIKLDYVNDYFDIIICNHVLEHVKKDKKAISEIYRVLRPGGFAILQTPISEHNFTMENENIKSKVGRKRYFGQEDHVRIYGKDYYTKLINVGFKLDLWNPNDHFSDKELVKYSLIENESIIIVKK